MAIHILAMTNVHTFVSAHAAHIYMYVNINTFTHVQTYLCILKCVKIVEHKAKPIYITNMI